MIHLALLAFLLLPMLPSEVAFRETTYQAAVFVGGQSVPRYDKGYLLYRHMQARNRLEVHKPDGAPLFDIQVPCPGPGECGVGVAAVDSRGTVAVTLHYRTPRGWAGSIRFLNAKGVEMRVIETEWYVPRALAFDEQDNLWTIGWLRDPLNPDFPEKEDHPIVRKYSPDGKELGRFLPRSLWPGKNSSPGSLGVGYWHMAAASDRIGAIIHENHADNDPEWVEWDLGGNLLSRTRLPDNLHHGRAFTSDGKLYARLKAKDNSAPQLHLLDRATATWNAVPTNLPAHLEREGIFLLGAHGNDLVYRAGPGNVRILRVAPGTR